LGSRLWIGTSRGERGVGGRQLRYEKKLGGGGQNNTGKKAIKVNKTHRRSDCVQKKTKGGKRSRVFKKANKKVKTPLLSKKNCGTSGTERTRQRRGPWKDKGAEAANPSNR